MAAVVGVSPSEQFVSNYVTVEGTGGGDYKNRVLLDGTLVATICHDTGFSTVIQVGATPATQTIDWQQLIGGTWTSVDTTTVDVTAGTSGAAVPFSMDSSDALKARIEDGDIAILEMAAGTYHDFETFIRFTRGASRPLTIRPAPGAALIFDGTGLGAGANGPFNFGTENGLPGLPTSVTDYITIDAAGTGGSIAIQNYDFGHVGAAMFGWADHIAVNGIIGSGCTGVDNGAGVFNQTHWVYINQGNGHAATNITANGWNVTGDVGRTMNGAQTFHEPQGAGRTLHSWTVTKLHHWALIYGLTGSLVDIDGWNGTNCDGTIDSPTGQLISGIVDHCNAHGSCGPLALGSGGWTNTHLADGGHNTP